ncbi:unnamed protein product [Durusdinium trenchii]|uniref:Gem-associated protein 2 n=1 Tax=Durusdinium trenchii TaxID=1381693 RepID=A0ABP0SSX4_9DINO
MPQIFVRQEELDEDDVSEEDGGFAGSASYAVQGEEYEEVVDEDERQADRDQQILQEACLPVSGAPLPPSAGPPKDADEYLRQVQWERLHCPQVMDVDVKERRSKQKVGGPLTGRDGRGGLLAQFQTPELPKDFYSQVWAEDTAAAFRHLRKLCQDSRPKEPPQSLTYEEWRRHVAKDQPCFDLLSQQDFVSINHLVVVAVDKIEADYETSESEKLELEGLDLSVAWTFAALAFLEEPLTDDIQYQLQRLRRNCCRLVTATESEARPRLALLLVLVGDVFGQQ